MHDISPAATCANSSITLDCTVDAAMKKSPIARAVLDSYNIDTCCGGGASIAEAALHAHVDPTLLVQALNAEPGTLKAPKAGALPQAASCGCGCR